MADTPPIQKVLSQIGINKALQRIRFGGVVGKQTILGILGAFALASIAWKASGRDVLILGLTVAVLLLIIAILNFAYANKHPVEATLEGSEMLAFQHQVLASKSLEAPKDSAIVPNPNGAPPQTNLPPTDSEQ